MRMTYERPEAEIVSFAALEQLALLEGRAGETDVGKDPSVSGGVTEREDF